MNNYKTPTMAVYKMPTKTNLLVGSYIPGAGGDPTPDPDEE